MATGKILTDAQFELLRELFKHDLNERVNTPVRPLGDTMFYNGEEQSPEIYVACQVGGATIPAATNASGSLTGYPVKPGRAKCYIHKMKEEADGTTSLIRIGDVSKYVYNYSYGEIPFSYFPIIRLKHGHFIPTSGATGLNLFVNSSGSNYVGGAGPSNFHFINPDGTYDITVDTPVQLGNLSAWVAPNGSAGSTVWATLRNGFYYAVSGGTTFMTGTYNSGAGTVNGLSGFPLCGEIIPNGTTVGVIWPGYIINVCCPPTS